jgi:hypothetical protein
MRRLFGKYEEVTDKDILLQYTFEAKAHHINLFFFSIVQNTILTPEKIKLFSLPSIKRKGFREMTIVPTLE